MTSKIKGKAGLNLIFPSESDSPLFQLGTSLKKAKAMVFTLATRRGNMTHIMPSVAPVMGYELVTAYSNKVW